MNTFIMLKKKAIFECFYLKMYLSSLLVFLVRNFKQNERNAVAYEV